MKVLYLSYDGMTDPLGGSQVLPYLQGLASRGHRISLISCEKPDNEPEAWERVRRICAQSGIDWHPLAYHKSPPLLSTMWDLAAMVRSAVLLQNKVGVDLVHCRSYVPALVGLRLKRRRGVRFLFDMRGFWPEERVEAGRWDLANPLFRAVFSYFKRRELDFFREADALISLTAAGRNEMQSRPLGQRPVGPVTVIPCCVDFDHFPMPSAQQRADARTALGIGPDTAVLGYLGSLGGTYMLDEMLRFFLALRERKSGARFLFVTRDDPATIHQAAHGHGIASGELIIRSAARDQVPSMIGAADYGISFIRPTFAKTASSPTKMGEMMALGIPLIVNAGVGDVDAVMADTDAGVTVEGFDHDSLLAAADALLGKQHRPDEIRAGAKRWFDLSSAISSYDAVYRSLEPSQGSAV